jgi:hypothetical protein
MKAVDEIIEYLMFLDAHRIPHDIADVLTHFKGVNHWLRKFGASEHVQLAGLVHTLYGAEAYPELAFKVTRYDIRQLVGGDAEHLVHRYCSLTTVSAEAAVILGSHQWLWDRWEDKPLGLSSQEYEPILWLLFANKFDKDYRLREHDVEVFNSQTTGDDQAWARVASHFGEPAKQAWKALYRKADSPSG